MINRLDRQTSPYLLQHQDNPVHWQPWDDQALALAKASGKPILLSIGYSACHWCHVMAHESFEDPATADLMNELFINIKVDREERPDLDRLYQTAHQLLTRNRGGWPLTMFLDPDDHVPFFGGTYFPPSPRHGLPGFSQLLRGIGDAYNDKSADIADYKAKMRDALIQQSAVNPASPIDPSLVEQACGQLSESFDRQLGGFGEAPKFPHASGLELLLDGSACTSDLETSEQLLQIIDFTLAAMSRGGLFDHLAGGFYRYSVDPSWTIPHFEKMLYDNGPLLGLYARRASATQSPWFRHVAEQTARWMIGEMQLSSGGLCSSLDADVDNVEGGSYVWAADEIESTLGSAYAPFADAYGLRQPANFEARWHLRLAPPTASFTLTDSEPASRFTSEREQLLKHRQQRPQPALDDKILTSWNALSIRSLAECGRLLDSPECLNAAMKAADFLRQSHWQNQRLLATSRDGTAHIAGYLDDYAFLIDALLNLLASAWRTSDLEFAIELTEVMLAQFEDPADGGFFFTAADQPKLLYRAKTFADESCPAGNGIAARALFELGHLIGQPRYLDAAEKTLAAAMTDAHRWPHGHATIVAAVLDHSMPPPQLVLRSNDSHAADAWRKQAHAVLGHRLRSYVISVDEQLPGLLAERSAQAGATVTAWLCVGTQCSLPVTEQHEFEQLLGEASPLTEDD